jgi:outer membrane protein TolC
MIRFRHLILALLLACGLVAAHSQETVRLTPDDAVDLAIKNNLTLESARVTLDTSKRKSDYVWNQFLPSVSATGTLSRDNWAATSQGLDFSALPNLALASTTLPQWHVNGAFSVSLDFSFALIEGIKSIRLGYQTGLITFEKARAQTEREVRKTYNQILLLEGTIALQKEGFAMAQRSYDMAEANYRAGLAPRLSVLQAQVSMENQKPAISEMENNLKTLKSSFAMTLGLPLDTSFELVPVEEGNVFIDLDMAELISKAASGKIDILELQKQIQALQSGRKARAMQNYTPFLRFGWSLTSMYSPMLDPFKDKLFARDNWNKGGNFSVTLGMSLNGLLPFTTEGQGIKDMDNNVRSMNIGLAQMITGAELEIFNKVNSLEKTRESAEAQKLTVTMAEESYRLTEEAYKAGLQSVLELQSAALSLNQAGFQLLSQQFSYLSDLIDLEYATGVPFGTLSSKNGNQER